MSNNLLSDLDELVEKNVISAESAEQIRIYYESKKENTPSRLPTVLGILGALLLGSGLVLVIAHNWDSLGRLPRTIISFLPLIIGQALCIYAYFKKKNNKGWKESTSVFLFFAVATCISLISQVYQVNGAMQEFLLTWIWLTIPLVYIMSSSVVSLLVIALATYYAVLAGYSDGGIPYWYLGIILLLAPHYYQQVKSPSSNFFNLHNWFFAISFLIALAAFAEDGYKKHEWIFIAYMAVSGTYYVIGRTTLMQQQRWFSNPFKILGLPGIICILLIWTFDDTWYSLSLFSSEKRAIAFNYPFAYVAIGLLAAYAYLLLKSSKPVGQRPITIISLTPFIFMLVILLCFKLPSAGILLFNLWVLAIGIHYVRKGATLNHLGILNFGLLVIVLLALLRFFDSDIPFIGRGIIFMAAGAGFFVSNYLIIKKRKKMLP